MDIIVDGYNVIFKISELGYTTEKCDIEAVRKRFLTLLERYKENRKHKLIVVFDGQGEGNASETRTGGIDVVFSSQYQDADEVIKNMVRDSENPRHITVITSDRDIKRYVRKYGCKIAGPLAFYRDIKKKVARLQGEGVECNRFHEEENDEPISKYLGPSKNEVQYWLKVFSKKTEKSSDD